MSDILKMIKQSNGSRIIVFNRSEELNGLNAILSEQLLNYCQTISKDNTAKVIVLTGKGRYFSCGIDKSINSVDEVRKTVDVISQTVKILYEMPKVVIAAVNGPVVGTAIALALVSDLLVCSDTAHFDFNFIDNGLCTDCGISSFLTQKIGYNRAMELLLLEQKMNISKAYHLGMVNKIVPSSEVVPVGINWADRICRQASEMVDVNKNVLRKSSFNSFTEQYEVERTNFEKLLSTLTVKMAIAEGKNDKKLLKHSRP